MLARVLSVFPYRNEEKPSKESIHERIRKVFEYLNLDPMVKVKTSDVLISPNGKKIFRKVHVLNNEIEINLSFFEGTDIEHTVTLSNVIREVNIFGLDSILERLREAVEEDLADYIEQYITLPFSINQSVEYTQTIDYYNQALERLIILTGYDKYVKAELSETDEDGVYILTVSKFTGNERDTLEFKRKIDFHQMNYKQAVVKVYRSFFYCYKKIHQGA